MGGGSQLDGPAGVAAGELLAQGGGVARGRRNDADRQPDPAPLAGVPREQAHRDRERLLAEDEARVAFLDGVDEEQGLGGRLLLHGCPMTPVSSGRCRVVVVVRRCPSDSIVTVPSRSVRQTLAPPSSRCSSVRGEGWW